MLEPASSAAVVVETAPLWVVADMVEAGRFEVVLVMSEAESVLGLLRRDAVLRLAPRLPEAPVRMLPLQKVIEVTSSISPDEAQVLFGDGSIDGLVVERQGPTQCSVVTREDFLSARA